MSDALYHALIVEHDRSPRNEGPLDGATHIATLDNPLCGDIVTVRVVVRDSANNAASVTANDTARITDARFEARGCALCRAAASMMTTRVIDRTVDDARALVAQFEAFVRAGTGPSNVSTSNEDESLGELVAFRGVQQARSRRTCATLPFRALAKALG